MGSFKELSIEWMEEIEKYNTLANELAAISTPESAPEKPTPLWLEILPLLKRETETTSDL